jgi:hypothetical protein
MLECQNMPTHENTQEARLHWSFGFSMIFPLLTAAGSFVSIQKNADELRM